MSIDGRRRVFNIILFFCLIILCLVGSYALVKYIDSYGLGFHRHNLDTYFLDIGQGDATMFYTENREVVLVDGGPDLSVLYQLGKSLPFYEKTIDLLVLTHPDSDHLNGLIAVLDRYRVKKILYTGVQDDLVAYDIFKQAIQTEGAEIIIARAGEKFNFGRLGVAILYPENSIQNNYYKDTNDSSLVLRLSYGDIDFLLTGDMPQENELALLETPEELASEVMKAGHHGSKTSSALEFIQAVDPLYGIFSVGKDNSYGHPHFRVIQNFTAVGAQILRTDELGTIHMRTQGKTIEIIR
jgi:competence protein ComEC